MIGRITSSKLIQFLLLCALGTFSCTSMAGQTGSGTGAMRIA